jgi:hypothetical protein
MRDKYVKSFYIDVNMSDKIKKTKPSLKKTAPVPAPSPVIPIQKKETSIKKTIKDTKLEFQEFLNERNSKKLLKKSWKEANPSVSFTKTVKTLSDKYSAASHPSTPSPLLPHPPSNKKKIHVKKPVV